MRRAARTDGNHTDVIDELRKRGIQVRSMASVGQGFPDLLCAFRDVLVLLEVKDGSLPPSDRKLTAAETEFVASWPKTYVVTSPEEAVRVVIEAARPPQSAQVSGGGFRGDVAAGLPDAGRVNGEE